MYIQEWHDDYLIWDPDKYDGVEQIVVAPTEIWLPDIGIQNRSTTSVLEFAHYSFAWGTEFTVSLSFCSVMVFSGETSPIGVKFGTKRRRQYPRQLL